MIAHPQSMTRLATLVAGLLLTLLGCLTFTAAEKPNATREAAAPAASTKPPRNTPAVSEEAAQQQRGIEVLKEQLDRYQRRVTEQQHRLDQLREELRIPTTEAQTPGASVSPTVIGSLERLRVEAFAEWTEQQSFYERLRAMPKAELNNALVTATTDAMLAGLLQHKMQAEQKQAELRQTFGPEHPDVKRATEAIATVNRQIEERVAGIMAGLKVKADAKQAKLDSLKAEIEKTTTQNIKQAIAQREYFNAKRDLESLQRVREALLIRILQEEVDAALPKSSPKRSPREP